MTQQARQSAVREQVKAASLAPAPFLASLCTRAPTRGMSCLHPPVIGNQAIQRALKSGFLQAKLTVNRPGDIYEQEANRVADTVMRMADAASSSALNIMPLGRHPVQRCSCGGPSSGGQCDACRERELLMQRKASAASVPQNAPPIVDRVLRSGGRPLDPATRSFMEPRFGRDFTNVRIHTDAPAAESAREVNALAYTVGSHVVFAASQYLPQSSHGQHLLAHELAHVVQQAGGSSAGAARLTRKSDGQAVQRTTCDLGRAPTMHCSDAQRTGHAAGTNLENFPLNSPRLSTTHTGQIAHFKSSWVTAGSKDNVEVHGYASCDGQGDANLQLSCNRAESVKTELIRQGITTAITTFAHGETDEFGSRLEDNRRVIITGLTAAPARVVTHRFRAASWSFLSCAECNPFTDDGTLGVTPPTTEPAPTSSFRQMHFVEAELGSTDAVHIAPGTARLSGSGRDVGISHFCGRGGRAAIVGATPPGSPRVVTNAAGVEGIEFTSSLDSRVGAVVPPTLPGLPMPGVPTVARGAPCGPLGTSPSVPFIGNRFVTRLFADGTKESGFLSASPYPSHFLYEDGALKMHAGSPVHPRTDFFTWATSTGVPLSAALLGFKVMRFACCSPGSLASACATTCSGGFTVPVIGVPGFGGFNPLACAALVGPIATSSCPTPCAPAGAPCPGGPLVLASNP